ncbi:uncharacterized protein NPIL_166721, partial [Nephila pilipes]
MFVTPTVGCNMRNKDAGLVRIFPASRGRSICPDEFLSVCVSSFVNKKYRGFKAIAFRSQPAKSDRSSKILIYEDNEFGIITEKHIVACDGASMMVKFGKITSCENHLCYAYAIHLAECDVLYNKQIDLGENIVEIEDKSHEEEDNYESEELIEDLDKALDLEFESG